MTGRTRRRAAAELRQRSCKTKIIYGGNQIRQKQNTAEAEYRRSRIHTEEGYIQKQNTTEAEYNRSEIRHNIAH